MGLKLQLAHCGACNGYYSSTVLHSKDLSHPEIIDHYFYHGEPWFTLDKKSFDRAVDLQKGTVRTVDLDEHAKDDLCYCSCANRTRHKVEHLYYLPTTVNRSKKALNDYVDQDIYFYDLYITYNNVHQDIPTRQAI